MKNVMGNCSYRDENHRMKNVGNDTKIPGDKLSTGLSCQFSQEIQIHLTLEQ